MPHIGATVFKMYAPTLTASRDADGMYIDGVASSTVRDHHGDQLTARALKKMEQSAVGMTIFMEHLYDLDKVFGKVTSSSVTKSALPDPKTGDDIYDLRMRIKVAESNAKARDAFNLIDQDQVKLGLSIGALIPEGGAKFDKARGGRYVIDDVDIIETSVVTIPANPRSFIDYAVKALSGALPDKVDRVQLFKDFFGDDVAVTGEDGEEEITKGDVATCPQCGHNAGCGCSDCSCSSTVHSEDAMPVMASSKPVLVKTERTDGIVWEGVEAALGDVVELTVDEGGHGTGRIVAKAGTPEAEAFTQIYGDPENPVALDLEVSDGLTDEELQGMAIEGAPDGFDLAAKVAEQEELERQAVAKAAMSSGERTALPDSAFACPSERKYPIRDSSGKLDPAHVRAALSRLGDSSNSQCGRAAVLAAARKLGIGEHAKGATKARVTVWDGDRVVEVDTGRSKPKGADGGSDPAQASPETADADDASPDGGVQKSAGPTDDDVSPRVMTAAAQTLRNSSELIKALTGQLTAARSEIAEVKEERDQAIKLATDTMENTRALLARLGDLPVGRKTGFTAVTKDFADLEDVYDASMRKAFAAPPKNLLKG